MTRPLFKNISLQKAWLVTLLDLMTLLLTFFIMLFAMSTMVAPTDENRAPFSNQPAPAFNEQAVLHHGINLNYLAQILSQKIDLFEGYQIKNDGFKLTIQLPHTIFEDPVNRQLNLPDKKRLYDLGEQLNNISNKIILKANIKRASTQDALLLAMQVANALLGGGYTSNLRVIQSTDKDNDFIQIVIFSQLREGK